jgi:hypothetical protein
MSTQKTIEIIANSLKVLLNVSCRNKEFTVIFIFKGRKKENWKDYGNYFFTIIGRSAVVI